MNFGKVALLALAGAGLLYFSSCNKEKESKEAPKFTINDKNNKNIDLSKPITDRTIFPLTVIAKPDKDLKVKEITWVVAYGSSSQPGKLTIKSESQGYVGKFEATNIPTNVEKGKIKFTATDNKEASTTIELDFNFGNVTPDPGQEATWGEVKNGAINHKSTATGFAAFDLKNGVGLNITTGSKQEDRYMMNTSTGDQNFKAEFTSEKVSVGNKDYMGNGTEFVKLSGVDFTTVTVAAAEAAFTAAGSKVKILTVATNDVVAAKKGNEFYILKIGEISQTGHTKTRLSQGYMKFQYKAKK